jgi:hypothetical protein
VRNSVDVPKKQLSIIREILLICFVMESEMRNVMMSMFVAASMGLLSACAVPAGHDAEMAANLAPACDSLEGYPDCHHGHLVDSFAQQAPMQQAQRVQ